MTASEDILDGLAESHNQALAQAYDNRHSMAWVKIDTATHAGMAEAVQASRERNWNGSLIAAADPDSEWNPALLRRSDGTAPPVQTIYGLPVQIDDDATGIRWDVGTPSPFPDDFWKV